LEVESQSTLAVEKLRMDSEIKRLEKELGKMKDITECADKHKIG
jgi:hypothetical protein